MGLVRLGVTVLVWMIGVGALAAWQEDEKRSTSGRRADDGVALQKLPLPADVPVVVTPDLKKALDALGVGSVVLSAERYQELSRLAEQARQQQRPGGEVLFTTLRLLGEVKALSGREVAELQFELEFRTDTAKAIIPVPFKGIRFSSATLNGAAPVWWPDAEKLSLFIKEPQQCKLHLTATVPLARVGNERRLKLERIPAAAVTTLDLNVPGNVAQASLAGFGAIPVTKGKANASQLKASALGILSELDLSWQVGEAATTLGAASIEGDVRITVEEATAQVETKLRVLPFQPLQLPWKVRLPGNAAQLRAELVRTEGLGTEPLVITQGDKGIYTITSPYPTSTLEYTQVVLRWRQSLSEEELKKKATLGTCEVLEPAGRQQAGTITVIAPESPVVMLRPLNLTPLERNSAGSDRDRRVSRYRYTQQPAGLDALALPASLTRGALEYKATHSLTHREEAWQLTTEVEITRTARVQLTSLEFFWPADWVVSRKVLFSPVVREIEQDVKAQRLRVLLDGKQPGAFSIRLESTPGASPPGLSLPLPYLTASQGMQGDRVVPVDLITLTEQVKLDGRAAELKVDPTTTGLREDDSAGGDVMQYHVTAHPATLVVSRVARTPKYRSRVEVYLARDLTQTRQTFEIRWNGPVPQRLGVLVPPGVRSTRFARFIPETGKLEPLPGISQGTREDGTPGGWESYLVELPAAVGAGLHLVALVDAVTMNPLTVPLVRFAEAQGTADGPVDCFVTHDLGSKVSLPELPGWRVTATKPGGMELRGESLDQLLALEVSPSSLSSAALAAQLRQTRVGVYPNGSSLVAEYAWDFEDLWSTELTLAIHAPAEEVTLQRWRLDDEPWPSDPGAWAKGDGVMRLKVKLPPSRLRQPLNLKATLLFSGPGTSLLQTLPAVVWESEQGRIAAGQRFWRVDTDPASWLLYARPALDETFHARASWLPTSPRPIGTSASLAFHDTDQDGPLLVVTAPRTALLLVFSVAALGVVRGFAARPGTLRRMVFVFPVVLIVLHLAAPSLAAAVLWGMIPGLAMGLVLLLVERWRRGRGRRPAVFQSAAAATMLGPPASTGSPARSVLIAEAPTLVPEPRSAVR